MLAPHMMKMYGISIAVGALMTSCGGMYNTAICVCCIWLHFWSARLTRAARAAVLFVANSDGGVHVIYGKLRFFVSLVTAVLGMTVMVEVV